MKRNKIRKILLPIFLFIATSTTYGQLNVANERKNLDIGFELLRQEKYDEAREMFNLNYSFPDADSIQKARAWAYMKLCDCLNYYKNREYDKALTEMKKIGNIDWQYLSIPNISSKEELLEKIQDGIKKQNDFLQHNTSDIEPIKFEQGIDSINDNKDKIIRQSFFPSNAMAIISSIILPGTGQLEKRHYVEGSLTLLGEILFVGGAAVTYYSGKQKLKELSLGTLGYDEYMSISKQYDKLTMANHILIGTSVLLYAFNIYRVITLPSKRQPSLSIGPAFINAPSVAFSAIDITISF